MIAHKPILCTNCETPVTDDGCACAVARSRNEVTGPTTAFSDGIEAAARSHDQVVTKIRNDPANYKHGKILRSAKRASDFHERSAAAIRKLQTTPSTSSHVAGRWLLIEQADKTITDVQEFPEVGMTIKTSDRYWVRDEDGRVYEAAWSEGKYGRDYWWDFEGESPVDPVEFMPHPLDPRFAALAITEDAAE